MAANVINQPTLFKKNIVKGTPISSSGFARSMNQLARAVEKMEIQVTATGLTGRIEWKNGIARIIIENA